ncbi:MAG: imelysin family protein [Verrucomicrobiota bacterium]|nr:imelysin family protein [Verrucomicrobiota bacterium]
MIKNFILFILLVFGFSSCSKTETSKEESNQNASSAELKQVVLNYANIVHASYVDSLNLAKNMQEKINNFLEAPSQKGLDEAKQSWVDSRFPYLQTEVYRFYGGPIDDEDGPEGLLNAWPMDESYVDYVKGSPKSGIINNPADYPEITQELLLSLNEKEGEENISCGYHAIEFLLWGQDFNTDGPGNRPFTDYTTAANADRRKEFLKITVNLLIENLQSLVNEWAPEEENYRDSFVNSKPKESFQKILLGMTLLAGFELAGERILVAYESKAQEDEHSCFSDTTHNDSIYDIVGIKNVWTGKYTRADGSIIEGPGIRNFALSIDTDLTEKIDNSLKVALKTSMEIPRPFDQAILTEKGSDTSNSIISLVEELENTADSFVIVAERAGVEISREPEE